MKLPVNPSHSDSALTIASLSDYSTLAHALPSVRGIPGARATLSVALRDQNALLIVFDDDPTGTQTAHDVDVFLDGSEASLRELLARPEPLVFISTNSRALPTAEADALLERLAAGLCKLNIAGRPLLFASRSDSTLRGHFPGDLLAIERGLARGFAQPPDGWLIAPAFFEGGRHTLANIQWVHTGDGFVRADQTEFARDPDFGYTTAHLPGWITKKSVAAHVPNAHTLKSLSLSVELLRTGGPEAVTSALMQCQNSRPVVVNAVCDADFEVFMLGLAMAERQGKRFLYRCAASFIKIRTGMEDFPLLQPAKNFTPGGPGLIVVGSYVEKTSGQLSRLLEQPGLASFEFSLSDIAGGAIHRENIERTVEGILAAFAQGRDAVLFTERTVQRAADRKFLAQGRQIMDALCTIVRAVCASSAFVIAKGGITSIEVARSGLGARRARVLGQLAKGVALWRLGPESLRPGLSYVVFPGNVGSPETLLETYLSLRG